MCLGGIFDYAHKSERLQEVKRELEDPNIWDDQEYAQKLGKERSTLEAIVSIVDELTSGLGDSEELLEISVEEDDEDGIRGVVDELDELAQKLELLEFRRMFSGEMDSNNAFLDIQAGSGGTEAQDWANMLLRMYLRWGEANGFKTEIIEISAGEVAGIKSATVQFVGDYAFGWLRTEIGVHRLVRKSPFDSGNRRHTSIACLSSL